MDGASGLPAISRRQDEFIVIICRIVMNNFDPDRYRFGLKLILYVNVQIIYEKNTDNNCSHFGIVHK